MDSKQLLQNINPLEVLCAGTLYLGITQSCGQAWYVLSSVVLFAVVKLDTRAPVWVLKVPSVNALWDVGVQPLPVAGQTRWRGAHGCSLQPSFSGSFFVSWSYNWRWGRGAASGTAKQCQSGIFCSCPVPVPNTFLQSLCPLAILA